MSRKPQTRDRRRDQRRNARVNALLFGVLLLVLMFGGFLAYLKQQNPGFAADPRAQTRAQRPNAGPKYDFYQNDSPPPAVAPAPGSPLPAPPAQVSLLSPAERAAPVEAGYTLQAGAFQRFVDADRRRAELLLLGIKARIERVLSEGREIHRVRAGPFASADEAKRLQRRLQRERISSFIQRDR